MSLMDFIKFNVLLVCFIKESSLLVEFFLFMFGG